MKMKIRSLVLVFFSLLLTQAAFGGPVTNCVSRPNQPDGGGGFITGFDCNFYREAVYPFDLTSFITNGGADLGENELVPGYIIWTTDANDVLNNTVTDPAAWKDVLFFDNNLAFGTASSQVFVDWPGGPSFPSSAAVTAAGYFVLPWNPSGVEFFDPGDNNHTFTVNENFAPVPEPSTLVLVFAAGLGTLIVRRRRC